MAPDRYRVDTFIREVLDKRGSPESTCEIYYRGNSKAGFPLEPKVSRNLGHRLHEDRLFREIQVEHPLDFFDDRTSLEKLVRMQHFSLPTRLLDVTSNPLVALYFACISENNPEHTDASGEVFILTINTELIKFDDSDTASCLANLSRLTESDRQELTARASQLLLLGLGEDELIEQFNTSVGRLLHFIKDEKPYFLPIIRPEDLFKVLCVKAKLSNVRIAHQAGAMLLFGLNTPLTATDGSRIGIETITVPAGAKLTILRELDVLGIRKNTVYPYLENTALRLADLYKQTSNPSTTI